MHPIGGPAKVRSWRALFLLWRLEFKGRIRKLLKQARRPAGAIMIVFWCMMAGTWLVQFISMLSTPNFKDLFASYLWTLGNTCSLVVAIFTALTLLFPGNTPLLKFRPVDTEVLFSGPFSRRRLILFKFASQACAVGIAAFFVSIVFLWKIVHVWLAAFAAAFLIIHFIRTAPVAYSLFLKAIEQRGARLGGLGHYAGFLTATAFRIGVCALILLAARSFLLRFGAILDTVLKEDPKRILALFWEDPLVARILWLFQPYGNLLVSERLFPDTLFWLVIAGSVNLALIVSVLILDADFMESELTSTQRRYARQQQVRRGQFAAPKAKQWGRLLTLPDFPHLHGAGAIAWRQTVGAIRSYSGLLIVFPATCLAVGLALSAMDLPDTGAIGIGAVTGIALYLSLLLSNIISQGFRADLGHMDTLKALPVPSTAIVLGESFATVLQMTYLHLAISVVVLLGFGNLSFLFSVLLLSPAFNAVLALALNLGFLLLPTHCAAGNTGDIVAAGKQMVAFLIVGAILLAGLAVGGILAAVAWFASGHSAWTVQLAAAIGLWIAAGVLVPITASVYRNFDFSADMPG